MKLFFEVIGVLVAFGALVFVLAWLQSKLGRALEESRRAGVGFFDAEPGPPEPPAGIDTNPRLRQNQPEMGALGIREERWRAEFEKAILSPPSGQKRKPFLCLDQHPDGWICGRTKGHIDNHAGGAHAWGQEPKTGPQEGHARENSFDDADAQLAEYIAERDAKRAVGAKTTLQDAPGSPNAAIPATSAPPKSADIPPRRKP